MTITDYASLQTTLAAYLNRGDLAAQLPTFIQLAEKRLGRRARPVASRSAVAVAAGALSVVLAADVGELRELGWQDGVTGQLGAFHDVFLWWNDADQYVLNFAPPVRAGSALLVYYRRIPPLTDAAPTNWLLQQAPDLYLYAALMEASPYLMEDERLTTWGTAYQTALDDFNGYAERREFSAQSYALTLPVVF